MTSSLKRRIERLERLTGVGADLERARAIVRAWDMVRDHPGQATNEDQALFAATSREEWQHAFWTIVESTGGLAAVVRASYEIKTER